MDDYTVKRLALVLAVQAEVIGMHEENRQREIEGKAMAYVYNNFNDKANDLRNLAYAHNDQL